MALSSTVGEGAVFICRNQAFAEARQGRECKNKDRQKRVDYWQPQLERKFLQLCHTETVSQWENYRRWACVRVTESRIRQQTLVSKSPASIGGLPS